MIWDDPPELWGTLRVRQWNEKYENHRTRELRRLDWVPVPNRMDDDEYCELVSGHPNGAAHFGAWLAILEIASRREPQSSRGILPREGAEIPRSLALTSRIREEVFIEALPRLLRLRWVEQAVPPSEIEQVQVLQQNARFSRDGATSRDNAPIEGKGIEGNRIPPIVPQGGLGIVSSPSGNGHKRKSARTTEDVLEKMHPDRRGMFLELWAVLPIGSKIRAAERFAETPLKNGDWPKVLSGAGHYASEVEEIRRQRPSFKGQHLQGWLADRRWEQYEDKPAAGGPGLIPEWKGYA